VKLLALALLSLLAAGEVRAAEPVGRLFFTPEQRAQMDAARAQRSRATLSAEIEQEAAPAVEILTYHGIVRRSDGKDTVWINDRAIDDGKETGRLPPARPRPDGSIVLELPQGERKINLKVGQSIELLSGTIAEPYARAPVPPKSAPKPAAETSSPPAASAAAKERDSRPAGPQGMKEAVPLAQKGDGGQAPSPPASGVSR